MLVLYNRPPFPGPPDVVESVRAFARYSAFPVTTINTWFGPHPGLDTQRFRVIVLHYTLFYDGLAPLTPVLDYLRSRPGDCLVALFQDEQTHGLERARLCEELGVDCIYTLLQPPYSHEVYGGLRSTARVVTYIPGYVSERLLRAGRLHSRPDRLRTIDVGYRGRRAPPEWGPAAAEKYEIAVGFKEHAAGAGLRLDIETDEAKRIYGSAWYRFLGRCRGTLGVEAGTSTLDLDGELDTAAHSISDRSSAARAAAGIKAVGRPMPYRTISPRHLEAASLGACQILFGGQYSGCLEPDVHYLPLRKDFSNLGEVLERFRDPTERQQVVMRARADLIESGELSYEGFVRGFDRELAELGVRPTPDADRPALDRALFPSRFRARRAIRTTRLRSEWQVRHWLGRDR
ncbi:MAG: hypothetical protein QOJ29_2081 [Thermoleophilaceae bacterium]|nr:hypothetical protein [Thermoleophilaceae bacterium]